MQRRPGMTLSVVVPMLNEERVIKATLGAVRAGAPAAEVIVVDGGSKDRSIEVARPHCEVLIEAPRGRAHQMNAGAAAAHGDAIAFVHADTIVPLTFARDIAAALVNPTVVGGRFDLALDDPSFSCRLLGTLISLRSRIMHSATGDQAIFIRRDIFAQLGGFANIELCEDVDLARRLKRLGGVACLRSKVITSARRWRKDGLIRTVLRMWLLKALFLAGVAPGWLKRHYADTR
jgi:rSAM/selenodomain-associated transferase 2